MRSKWTNDIHEMQSKYGVHGWIHKNPDKLTEYLQFRAAFLQEELTELNTALENRDSPEVVDALIDLCVVAIGTLDALTINVDRAWDEVHKANMNKEVGIKETRPNPLGLPDLIKPEGWTAPNHYDNTGILR